MIADVALTAGTDVEKIKQAKVGKLTVADAITESITKIGENITLRRAASLEVGKGAVGSYMHSAVAEGLGKIGVLVALESTGKTEELLAIGRNVAMQVAWSNPQALDPSGLNPDVVRREKDVLAAKAREQGKPANVIDKIVESGLKTFYKEVCLLEQAYIHDPSKSVAQAVKEAEGKAGAPIKVKGYVRYGLGEGIEREEKDFAAEVAAAVRPRRYWTPAATAIRRYRIRRHIGAAHSRPRRRNERIMASPIYRRVVVKVSGEALMGPDSFGIHQPTLERIAADLVAAQALGVAVGI